MNFSYIRKHHCYQYFFKKKNLSWCALVPTSWLVDFGISSSDNDEVVKLSKLMKNVQLTFDVGCNSVGLEYMISCMLVSILK